MQARRIAGYLKPDKIINRAVVIITLVVLTEPLMHFVLQMRSSLLLTCSRLEHELQQGLISLVLISTV